MDSGNLKGIGLTEREREYVKWYKQFYKETGVETETFKKIAEVMGITEKSANAYRYTKPRVKAEILAWKGETFTPEGEMKQEILSIRVIMQKLQNLYNILESKGNSRVSDMTDILKTLATLMTKFNTTYEDDLDKIQKITFSDLLKKWSSVGGKLLGNKRAASMIVKMMQMKEDPGALVVEKGQTVGNTGADKMGSKTEETSQDNVGETAGSTEDDEPKRNSEDESGVKGNAECTENSEQERTDTLSNLVRVSSDQDVFTVRD